MAPVLFVHGAGAGGWQWQLWERLFAAAGFDCHCPDLTAAPQGIEQTRFSDYLRQVEGWMGEFEQPPVMIGASLGGLLALKAAEQRGARALVLINPVPPAGTVGWPRERKRFPQRVRWSKEASLEETRRSMPEAESEVIRWAHERWRDESGLVMQTAFAGVPVSRPNCPILLVIGSNDNSISADVGLSVSRRLGADALYAEGVSHVGALLGGRAGTLAKTALAWVASH